MAELNLRHWLKGSTSKVGRMGVITGVRFATYFITFIDYGTQGT